MWKFILFIIIGSIVIWQLGLLNMGGNSSTPPISSQNQTVQKEEKRVQASDTKAKEDKKTVSTSEEKEEVSIKKNALASLISGKVESINIQENKPSEQTQKKQINRNALQNIAKSASSQDSYQNMLEKEAQEDTKPENAVVVKGSSSLTPPKKELSEEEKYANMLEKEAQDSAGDNVVRLGSGKSVQEKKETKKILEEEPELTVKEEIKPVSIKEDEKTSKVLFRENLKKLIASAGVEVKDNKLASLLKEETPTENAVKIKPKSKKDLIKEIISEVEKQSEGENKEYVVGLLKEVSTSKIDILKVEKDYTLVKIKAGDNLWNIAKRIYNDPFKYKLIEEANKDILTDPNLVRVGMVIKVPKIK